MAGKLAFLTESLHGFVVGVPQQFKLQVEGGSAPYAFKITTGTLPAGLTMSNDGIISGEVMEGVAGTTIFVTVTDAKGTEATQAFDVQIITPPRE